MDGRGRTAPAIALRPLALVALLAVLLLATSPGVVQGFAQASAGVLQPGVTSSEPADALHGNTPDQVVTQAPLPRLHGVPQLVGVVALAPVLDYSLLLISRSARRPGPLRPVTLPADRGRAPPLFAGT